MENEILISSTLEVRKNGKGVEAVRQIQNANRDILQFYAPEKDLRKEKTGIHGRIELYLNTFLLGYDNFNFEKGGQRKSFAGDIFKKSAAQELSSVYNREDLTTDLESFTFDAWKVKIESGVQTELVKGDPFQEVSEFISRYVIKGGGTIINALPKQGKSYISMAMAVSVDAGVNQLWDVQQANALYINLERSASSMKRRLGGVNTALGLDPSRPLRLMNVRGRSLLDIIDSVRFQIEEHDIQFIVVDSISRAGMGSLIEDRPAMRITDELNKLVEETDRSWIGIAHRAWSNEHVFGSVHFLAAADIMLDIESVHSEVTKEMGIMMSVSGQNDLPPSKPEIIALTFDSMGVTAMRKANLEEFPELMEAKDEVKDRIKEFLKNKPLQRPRDIAKGTGIKGDSIRPILSRLKYDPDENPDGIFIEQGGRYGNRTYQFQEKEKPW